jgi:hypothetical protein
MSHWHRLPRAVSVKYLLQRSKREFILDEALFPYRDMFRSLSQNIFLIHDLCAKGSTAMQVSAACQNRQSILATANPEFVNQLNSGPPNSWGLLLVPESEKAREDVLNSLFSGLLRREPLLLNMPRSAHCSSIYAKSRRLWVSSIDVSNHVATENREIRSRH